jgi:hypothetical protein
MLRIVVTVKTCCAHFPRKADVSTFCSFDEFVTGNPTFDRTTNTTQLTVVVTPQPTQQIASHHAVRDCLPIRQGSRFPIGPALSQRRPCRAAAAPLPRHDRRALREPAQRREPRQERFQRWNCTSFHSVWLVVVSASLLGMMRLSNFGWQAFLFLMELMKGQACPDFFAIASRFVR